MHKKKTKITIFTIFLVTIALIIGMATYLHSASYAPSPAAITATKNAQVSKDATVFKSKHSRLTVIFYPGAMVEPNSYSIWARDVAKAEYTVKIAHFPLNMAFFKLNAADSLVQTKDKYVIGGHSLGGAMAARYAHKCKNKKLKGVFFLASYADEKGRLDNKPYSTLSITATHDGVLNWNNYKKYKKYLPKDTSYVSIKGGNHGGFGSYGNQKGDKKATISNYKQQQIIAKQIIIWLNKIK